VRQPEARSRLLQHALRLEPTFRAACFPEHALDDFAQAHLHSCMCGCVADGPREQQMQHAHGHGGDGATWLTICAVATVTADLCSKPSFGTSMSFIIAAQMECTLPGACFADSFTSHVPKREDSTSDRTLHHGVRSTQEGPYL
jgi:hypothetical protein